MLFNLFYQNYSWTNSFITILLVKVKANKIMVDNSSQYHRNFCVNSINIQPQTI